MKKMIAFDLDGTLAPSKSTLPERMATLMNQLLENHMVCIISGGKYELFQRQVLTQITTDAALLKNLHLMPTSGTRYYSYDDANGDWKLNYAEDFTPEQKERIIKALDEALDESGHRVEKTYGPTIEDRDSQITLSPLGQEVVSMLGDEGLELKESWDPDMKLRMEIAAIAQNKLADFNVKVAGLTSIDVTIPGVDKAYGMKKLIEAVGITKEDILFYGDKIIEGGNDYAVYQMGIDCVSVRHWEDTAVGVETIIKYRR